MADSDVKRCKIFANFLIKTISFDRDSRIYEIPFSRSRLFQETCEHHQPGSYLRFYVPKFLKKAKSKNLSIINFSRFLFRRRRDPAVRGTVGAQEGRHATRPQERIPQAEVSKKRVIQLLSQILTILSLASGTLR